MKIVLNIEKKHLIFFSVFLVLVGGIFVIAAGNPKVFHEYLYTDVIESHNSDKIVEIGDNTVLKLEGGENNGLLLGGIPTDNVKPLYRIYATSGELNYGGGTTKNIFRGKICSDNTNCILVKDLINGNNAGSGTGGNLHVSGATALNTLNIPNYLKTTQAYGGDVLCDGVAFGFKNTPENSNKFEGLWCDRSGSIRININSRELRDITSNGGDGYCNEDEILCGAKHLDGTKDQFDKFYCCSLPEGITVDTSSPIAKASREEGGNGFCKTDGVVCGVKNKNRVNNQLDEFYCCKLL